MFEPLKIAIDKARRQREGAEGSIHTRPSVAVAQPERPANAIERKPEAPKRPVTSHAKVNQPIVRASSDDRWAMLNEVALDENRLLNQRIITRQKANPAYVAFDQLRTRLVKVMRDNNWQTLAITSPMRGCGKSFVSLNLAMSLCRQPDHKSILFDLDLKAPSIAPSLGWKSSRRLAHFLAGHVNLDDYFVRIGNNLALGLNTDRVRDSSELLQSQASLEALESVKATLNPDTIIYDLPPILETDDVMAFLPHVDCVLLVAASRETTARQIDECERLFAGQTNFLGVLLNKTEQLMEGGYYSEYYGDA